jgi:predicted nucleic acid-binding protein
VWVLLPVSDGVLRNVEAAVRNLPAHVYLRAGDAIHLVSARDAGFSEIWSNDRHLLGAARHFGLRGRSAAP